MSDAFIESLHSWQNFYFMSGGAAATLMGLLFVAVSLGSHLVPNETDERFNKFITPILTYFVSVLLLACVMLVPQYPPFVFGALVLALGVFGAVGIIPVVDASLRLTNGPFSPHHFFWNVLMPAIGYLLIVIAGLWVEFNGAADALYLVALGEVVLLITGVWRAWELVVWIARQPRGT